MRTLKVKLGSVVCFGLILKKTEKREMVHQAERANGNVRRDRQDELGIRVRYVKPPLWRWLLGVLNSACSGGNLRPVGGHQQ